MGSSLLPIWNPTDAENDSSLFETLKCAAHDCAQTALVNKLDLIDATTEMAIKEVRRMLETQENIKLVGHSQGGAIVSSVAENLLPEERARVDIVTIGGAAVGFPEGMRSVTAYVNTWDVVPTGVGSGSWGSSLIDQNEDTNVFFYEFGDYPGHLGSTHSVEGYLRAARTVPAAETALEAHFARRLVIEDRGPQ